MMATKNIAPNKLKNAELMALLRALKRPEDKAIPTKKADMVELYNKWKGRSYLDMAEAAVEVDMEDDIDEKLEGDTENDELLQYEEI